MSFFSKTVFLIILIPIKGYYAVSGQQHVTFALLADFHITPGSASDSTLHLIVDEIKGSDIDFKVVAS